MKQKATQFFIGMVIAGFISEISLAPNMTIAFAAEAEQTSDQTNVQEQQNQSPSDHSSHHHE